jgi:hypothetical protein
MAGGRARVHARLAVEADGREALEKSAEAFRSYERGCRLFPDGKCKNLVFFYGNADTASSPFVCEKKGSIHRAHPRHRARHSPVRGAASADAMSAVKKDIKDMATSVNVGLANLQKPSTQKSLKAKLRARLHFVVALVGLGVVAAVGTYIAKRGLPDIDPVKVRGARAETKRAAVSPLPSLDRAPNRKDGTPGSEPRVSWCLFYF